MVHNTVTESDQARLPGLMTDLPSQNSAEVEGWGARLGKLYIEQNKNKRTKAPCADTDTIPAPLHIHEGARIQRDEGTFKKI